MELISITISFVSLIITIIFGVNIIYVDKKQFELKMQLKEIEEIKEVLILKCVVFSTDENNKTEIIDGKTIINNIKSKYNCDDLTAIKIYLAKNE